MSDTPITLFDSESFSPAYVRRLLDENLRLAQANERLEAELATERRLREELREIGKAGLSDMGAFADVMINDKRLLAEDNASLRGQVDLRSQMLLAVASVLDGNDMGIGPDDARYTPALESARRLVKQVTSAPLQGQHGQTCSPPCNPEWDATDASCSCWWRGDDHGARKVAQMVLDAFDGDLIALGRKLRLIVSKGKAENRAQLPAVVPDGGENASRQGEGVENALTGHSGDSLP